MRLSKPKIITWWIAIALGVIGIILYLINTAPYGVVGFVLVATGWLLLVLGTYLKGL